MGKTITARIAEYGLLGGTKLYQVRARLTLPYLVRLAQAGRTVYYSDLAKELKFPNPRSFNYILGAIGNALIELADSAGIGKIPPIQCIVINKSYQMPGEGVGWFISTKDFGKLSKEQQQILIDAELVKVFAYPHWNWVLSELCLQPLEIDLSEELEKAKNFRGGGESESHRKFKKYIANNPTVLGLNDRIGKGITEYKLPSADTMDVLFTDQDFMIGVEVKSKISGSDDILRGIFQCVKYKELLRAEQIVNNKPIKCKVVLALEGSLPNEHKLIKKLLGIEVIEKIEIIP